MNATSLNLAELRRLYTENSVARTFLDYAAGRERDQSETKVDRALAVLRREGNDFNRRDITDLFRSLADVGCGQFVVGRRGWPSRFVWSAGMKSIGQASAGGADEVNQISPEDEDQPIDSIETESFVDSIDPSEDNVELGEEGRTGLEKEEEDPEDELRIVRPFDPARIRVETKAMVISQLLGRMKYDEIDLAPDFQRKGGIWSRRAKSQLIESLLIRIPLPGFYMDGSDENRWLVVDGLQRLTTLKEFAIDKTLVLSGLEFLTAYQGKGFEDLPRDLQRRIDETQVTVFLIQENTPPEVKFNIFKRINTGGLPLSAQEIRHALYQGPATTFLHDLAGLPEFLKATRRGIRDDRMGDRECILRLLAFIQTPYRQYKANNLDTFLNECMMNLNKMSKR